MKVKSLAFEVDSPIAECCDGVCCVCCICSALGINCNCPLLLKTNSYIGHNLNFYYIDGGELKTKSHYLGCDICIINTMPFGEYIMLIMGRNTLIDLNYIGRYIN